MVDNEGVRLQKVLSQAGIASRRVAERMILDGRVEVDGRIVTELGTRVDPANSVIRVDGARVMLDDELVHLALNKPLGMVSTMSDDQGRPCIGDLIENRVRGNKNLFHVGRLDADTEGLILLTNDGDFTNLIAHASHNVPKVYEAKVKGKPRESQVQMIARGVLIDGVKTAPAKIRLMEETETNAWYEVTLHEGRNQQIRKMFDSIGHSVVKLRRIAIGFLKDEKLKPGELRFLKETEVKRFFKIAAKTPTGAAGKPVKKTTSKRFDKA